MLLSKGKVLNLITNILILVVFGSGKISAHYDSTLGNRHPQRKDFKVFNQYGGKIAVTRAKTLVPSCSIK